jgi:hypothetical protein
LSRFKTGISFKKQLPIPKWEKPERNPFLLPSVNQVATLNERLKNQEFFGVLALLRVAKK